MTNFNELDNTFFNTRKENFELKTELMEEFLTVLRKYPQMSKSTVSGAFAQTVNHLYPNEDNYRKSRQKGMD